MIDSKDKMSDPQADKSEPTAASLPFVEFVVLMALMMSLVALSTDAILPSLDIIGHELGHSDPQQLQQVITALFAGLAVGQLVYGPLSDQIGRKKCIYLGLALFVIGNLLSWSSTSFSQLLIGRLLQGFGVAGPRIILMALIRDMFQGRAMARIMSFIMGVFIFVPAIAPIIGQFIAHLAGWRAVFLFVVFLACVAWIWFGIRQRETLPASKRVRVTPSSLWNGTRRVFTTPSCFGYMIAAGFAFGPFMFYISTAQDLFQTTYAVGERFPFFFAGLALSVGLASFLNSKLVMTFGMRKLVNAALMTLICLSSLALILSYQSGFVPPLWLFLMLFSPLFFCMGLLFGNINALAMEDVGQIAGLASAWIGAVSTGLAMTIATLMGQVYDGTILALGGAFMISGLTTLLVVQITERLRAPKSDEAMPV
ncbi:multidrug effflux MFS transporter [Cohaesibacter celericrescens]|uniref:Bcr/CflA family drug resistance efflux transporter n=1 Tax=Cohaesibacter celericrescens TaxID=2067669 RepID=A0A2N5XK97_9HYPH|nr:multidrug effflux MFS transporter [Cohaesibacter celericrescens]PLW74936.1 Bcr/CflA family drug resistance efflux transporter [Cohaesibacter celericrescens]